MNDILVGLILCLVSVNKDTLIISLHYGFLHLLKFSNAHLQGIFKLNVDRRLECLAWYYIT